MTTLVPFNTWNEFKGELIERLGGTQAILGRYLFRGQARSEWRLVSSFDRAFPTECQDPPDKEYAKYMAFFKTQYFRVGGIDERSGDVQTAWVAQHYGVPTRLLDFTASPYVAAFFAFFYSLTECADNYGDSVAIWAFDWRQFDSVAKKGGNANTHWNLINPQFSPDGRIQTQKGRFLECLGDIVSFDEYCDGRADCAKVLQKLTVPASEAEAAVNDLILMGISPAEIYPDFEGVAKYVRLRMALNGFRMKV